METSTARVLLDCGATSLTAMKRFGVDPGLIDSVSHYHADHYGGIPFLILDGQFNRRALPLAIAGPGDVERRITTAMEIAFPGSSTVRQRYSISFHQLQETELRLGAASVRAVRVAHTPGSEAVGLRIAADDTVIAYSGDTEWTDVLPTLAAGADLLICEAYTWAKPVRYHLDHQTLAAHRAEFTARRVMLTHCGPEMLAHLAEAMDETTHDGLRLTLRAH
jgi:ribonuclease BN (tRNA processing enzyme)